MNLASVESIKSYFDLANMTEEELQEKINQLNFTSNLISNSLDRALTVYKSVIGAEAEAQQIQFSDTIELLDSLNDSEGLRLFTYLFGYYENKIFLPTEISLSNIINVLSVIDKFPPNPRLPWPKVNGFLLFDEKTEDKLSQPGTHNISQNDFYGRVKVFDSEEDIIISNLSSPEYNSRRNDIFKLFMNLKIAQCINKTPNIEYLNLQTQKILGTDHNWFINNKNSKINLDEYVTKLFKKVYEDTEKDIKSKILVPKKIDINNELWDILLKQAIIIKDNLIMMQAKYSNILDHFTFGGKENELLQTNKLLIELREFLQINKTKKEYIKFNIDERFLPDRNTIESITGGKGLMKRISALEGGVIEFKKIYPKWIAEKLDRERTRADVGFDFKQYDKRYVKSKLNEKDMTLENIPIEEI